MAAKAALKGSGALQGADRVAAVLMAMGKPAASRLMKHFESDEIKLITRAVAELRPVPPQQIQTLIEDFAVQFASGGNLVGTAAEVEKMLSGALPPEQVSDIMADLLGNANRSIWERVSSLPEAQLAAYIAKEHPQTAALILSKVNSGCAAKVMGQLSPELRNSLMRRMLTLKPVAEESLRLLERVVHDDLMTNAARNSGADTHARMADIINKMERDQMDAVLLSLAESRPKSAEILKGLLFTFEDIVKLSPKARSSLFDKAPNDKVVVALKGTEQEFRDIILQSLSARVRKMIEQEMSSSEPSPQRDVLAARRAITELALDMAARGEIDVNTGREEEVLVR
jgi:flagellar motor switch protein FliG